MCPLEPRSDSRSSPSPAPGACMAPEPLRGSSLDGTRRPRQATAFPHQSRPPVLRAPAEGPGLEGSTALRLLFQRLAVHMLRLFLLRSLLCVRAATVRGEPCGLRLSRTCSSRTRRRKPLRQRPTALGLRARRPRAAAVLNRWARSKFRCSDEEAQAGRWAHPGRGLEQPGSPPHPSQWEVARQPSGLCRACGDVQVRSGASPFSSGRKAYGSASPSSLLNRVSPLNPNRRSDNTRGHQGTPFFKSFSATSQLRNRAAPPAGVGLLILQMFPGCVLQRPASTKDAPGKTADGLVIPACLQPEGLAREMPMQKKKLY